MKSAPLSLQVFGIYMIAIPGLLMMSIPTQFLDLFQMQAGDIIWPFRIVGLLAFALGVYYLIIAKHDFKPIYGWTVIMRYFAAAFMIFLWVIKEAEYTIIGFAAVDFLAASWTWFAMRSK